MRLRFLFLFFLSTLAVGVYAQNQIDSLKTVLSKQTEKKDQLQTLKSLTVSMSEKDHPELLTYFKQSLSTAKEIDDKDMLVMYHEFEFEHEGKAKKIISSMINIGEDQTYTAMANTVGLPLAIAAKMILNDQIGIKGVTLPINKEIYEPILAELSEHGIVFNEQEQEIEEYV